MVKDLEEQDDEILQTFDPEDTLSTLNSVNYKYAETTLDSDGDLLAEEKDENESYSEVQAVEMKENDIELRIWAQFVRPNSKFIRSQKDHRPQNSDLSANINWAHSNIHDKRKDAMPNGLEQEYSKAANFDPISEANPSLLSPNSESLNKKSIH